MLKLVETEVNHHIYVCFFRFPASSPRTVKAKTKLPRSSAAADAGRIGACAGKMADQQHMI